MSNFGRVKYRGYILSYVILFLDVRNTPDLFAYLLDLKGLAFGHQLVELDKASLPLLYPALSEAAVLHCFQGSSHVFLYVIVYDKWADSHASVLRGV